MASRAAEHVEFKLSNDNNNTDIKRKHKKLLRKHVSDGNNCRKAQKKSIHNQYVEMRIQKYPLFVSVALAVGILRME